AADAALDGDPHGQLLQRPAVPGLEDPQRLADPREPQAVARLAVWRQAPSPGARALSLVCVAGLRPAAQGPLRQGPGKRLLCDQMTSKLASQPVALARSIGPSGGAGDI